jgi:hypothetical protein
MTRAALIFVGIVILTAGIAAVVWCLTAFSFYDSGAGEPEEGYQAAAINAGVVVLVGLLAGLALAVRADRRGN